VLDVMRWVLFRTPDESGETSGRDHARAVQLVSELDDLKRSLLLLVAKSTLKDDSLRLTDAADELGQDAQTITDAVRALNHQALWGGRDIVTLRAETTVSIHGQRGKKSYLTMRPEVARLVRAAARSASADAE